MVAGGVTLCDGVRVQEAARNSVQGGWSWLEGKDTRSTYIVLWVFICL
jgi:hypothetical protein